MKSFKSFLNENKGLEYEKLIKKIMRTVTRGRSSQLTRSKGGGSFSSHDTDMELRINKQLVPIEIKANMRAQMGGISIKYNYETKELEVSKGKDLDDETIELIKESVGSRLSDIDKAIEWFRKNDEIFQYNKTPGFPLQVSQNAWKEAVDKGIVKELNSSIKYTTDFINAHYKSKNVHYMQIGGAGLFYLDENPLGIDIPRLEGNINIEFRAGKSGKKYNKTNDYEYSTVVLRLQGRLSFKGKSNITLDDEDSANEFFDRAEIND